MNTLTVKDFYVALKARRIIMMRHALIAIAVALIIGFSIPKQYTSRCVIVAEEQDDLAKSAGLGSLASLAGVSLNMSNDAIIPDLYPTVVLSRPFVVDLLYDTITTMQGDKFRVIDYVKTQESKAWWLAPLQWFSNDTVPQSLDPLLMTRKHENFVKDFAQRLECVCTDDGTIELASTLQDPMAARQLTEHITRRLQAFIVKYRTAKAASDVEYYRDLSVQASETYNEHALAYAKAYDANSNASLMKFKVELEKLATDMNTAHSAYTTIQQQLLKSEAKVRENTPAFTVIEPADAPAKHSSPKKAIILLALLFVTLGLDTLYVYTRLLLK